MQYSTVALLALAAGVMGAPEKRQEASATYNTISLLAVLQTALPSSVLSEALANPSGLYSEVASEFAAGSTPAWFTSLPSDIQTILVPSSVATDSALLSSVASNATGIISSALASATAAGNSTGVIPISSGNSTIIGGNNSTSTRNGTVSTSGLSSSTRSGSSSSTSSSGSGSSSSSGSGSSSSGSTASSSGGASLPTAFSFGLAGAVGLVGVLAL